MTDTPKETTSQVPAAAPQAKPGTTIGQLLERNQKAIKSVLPREMETGKFLRLALEDIRRNPQLMRCDTMSLIGALMTAGKLGLVPGISGNGWLIPRKNRGQWEAQFQVGYRGLMKLAFNSGLVKSIEAEVVHEKDFFDYQLGTKKFLTHKPALGERGDTIMVWAQAELKSGATQFTVMTVADINQVRDQFAKASGGPWVTHWSEMAKKTVLRKLCKYLPSSTEMATAVTLDEQLSAGQPQQVRAEVPLDFDMDVQVQDPNDISDLGGLD